MAPLSLENAKTVREMFEQYPEHQPELEKYFLESCSSTYMVWCNRETNIKPGHEKVLSKCQSLLNEQNAGVGNALFNRLKNLFSETLQRFSGRENETINGNVFGPAAYVLARNLVDFFFPENQYDPLLPNQSTLTTEKTCREFTEDTEQSAEESLAEIFFTRELGKRRISNFASTSFSLKDWANWLSTFEDRLQHARRGYLQFKGIDDAEEADLQKSLYHLRELIASPETKEILEARLTVKENLKNKLKLYQTTHSRNDLYKMAGGTFIGIVAIVGAILCWPLIVGGGGAAGGTTGGAATIGSGTVATLKGIAASALVYLGIKNNPSKEL